jgi:hypothetical protein
MTPILMFSLRDFEEWVKRKKDPLTLQKELECLRKAVKKITGYQQENNHFLIEDDYKRPQVGWGIYDGKVRLWSFPFERSLGCYKLDSAFVPILKEILSQLKQGKTICSECRKWVKEYVSFSFLGAVCKKCTMNILSDRLRLHNTNCSIKSFTQ